MLSQRMAKFYLAAKLPSMPDTPRKRSASPAASSSAP